MMCAMEFRTELSYDASPDEVFAMLSDPAFREQVAEAQEVVSADVRLTPTTFLLNKRGEIVKRYVGAPDFAALHALVEQLLAEG